MPSHFSMQYRKFHQVIEMKRPVTQNLKQDMQQELIGTKDDKQKIQEKN